MNKKCKLCGAPLNPDENKCDYCGKVHGVTEQSTIPVSHQPQNDIPDLDWDQASTKSKLAINIVAGIFAAINVVVLALYTVFFWNLIISATTTVLTDNEYAMIGLAVIGVFGLMITSLVLHIVGLVQSKKHGISVVGHVLGLVGVGITLITVTMLSFVSIILLFLAAIFTLIQKNVNPPRF